MDRALVLTRSHYPKRESASDFKDADILRFHSDVVFDLFIETRFLHLNHSLIQFFKTCFSFLGITGPE